jgi:serine/threonine-protein kinase HipA
MRKAEVIYDRATFVGILSEEIPLRRYVFEYDSHYQGPPVSLTMPISKKEYVFDRFPPYFEGVLPEGLQLEGLLKIAKLDRNDYFGQLLSVGADLVGAFSVFEVKSGE